MTSYSVFLGIDVAKAKFDVFNSNTGEYLVLPNSPEGIGQLLERHIVPGGLVVCESTGGFERALVLALSQAGADFHVSNPGQVRSFAKAIGWRAKTDRKDAHLLVEYAKTRDIKADLPWIPEDLELRSLVTRHRQISDLISMEKNRLKQAYFADLRASVQTVIDALKAERDRVDLMIIRRINHDPAQAALCQAMQQTIGVGPTISITLLANLPELGRYSRESITALVGLAPWTRESGAWKGKSHIGGGRATARWALVMAAFTAIRRDPEIHAYYLKLVAAGKPKKVAVIACARKILVRLNARIRDFLQQQQANPPAKPVQLPEPKAKRPGPGRPKKVVPAAEAAQPAATKAKKRALLPQEPAAVVARKPRKPRSEGTLRKAA
jgi:transposase